MTFVIAFSALFFVFAGILFPGWGIKRSLEKMGLEFEDDQLSSLLCCFALGVHLNALIYLGVWTFGDPTHPIRLAIIIVFFCTGFGLLGWLISTTRGPAPTRKVMLTLAIGASIGIVAAWRFPSTLDSIQVLQIQQFLFGRAGGHTVANSFFEQLGGLFLGGVEIPTQPGFGGLILLPSLLQPNFPVVTIAAANKIALLALAACVSVYICERFRIRPLFVGSSLIFAGFVFSQFGTYGLFATGKDSIFSVLMSVASIAAINDSKENSNESGLFMSAAILLGAVSVPYLLVFWAIYFAVSGGSILRRAARQAAWCVYPFTIAFVGVRNAFASPGQAHLSLLVALVAGALIVGAVNLYAKRTDHFGARYSDRIHLAFSFLPAACILSIHALMPVTVHIIQAYKDGLPITSAYPPLDGKMTATQFVFGMYPTNNSVLSALTVVAMAIPPVIARKYRTAFHVALCAFLPATALFALANVKFGIHLLPDFNLWDISRDTVQWYFGATSMMIVLATVSVLFKARSYSYACAALVGCLFCIGLAKASPHFRYFYSQKPFVTSTGGFSDAVSAKAFDVIWHEGRGIPVYVEDGSPFELNFYSYQMFGGSKVDHFDPKIVGTEPRQLFLLSQRSMRKVAIAAKSLKASGEIQKFSDDAFAVILSNDGRGGFEPKQIPELSSEFIGMYGLEETNGRTFRWSPQTAEIRLFRLAGGGNVCVNLGIVNTWGDPDLQIAIEAQGAVQEAAIPREADFAHPFSKEVCLVLSNDGEGRIGLKANKPAKQFPNDTRTVAFGILTSLDNK